MFEYEERDEEKNINNFFSLLDQNLDRTHIGQFHTVAVVVFLPSIKILIHRFLSLKKQMVTLSN